MWEACLHEWVMGLSAGAERLGTPFLKKTRELSRARGAFARVRVGLCARQGKRSSFKRSQKVSSFLWLLDSGARARNQVFISCRRRRPTPTTARKNARLRASRLDAPASRTARAPPPFATDSCARAPFSFSY